MGYKTTGSNIVIPDQPLDIEILISCESLRNIALKGIFKVANFNAILSDMTDLKCTLFGKTEEATIDMKTARYTHTNPVEIAVLAPVEGDIGTLQCNVHNYDKKFKYLRIEISGGKYKINHSEKLDISFYDNDNPDQKKNTIEFKLKTQSEPPSIEDFYATPSVLQGNYKPTTLSWEGHADSFCLREGTKVLKSGDKTFTEYRIDPVPIGDHTYTLEATLGTGTVTKKVAVRALDLSGLSTKANPLLPYLIGNFCPGHYSTYLFSLMLKKRGKKVSIDHIGFSHEGFYGNWEQLKLSESDKDKLKPFATSPMLHLKDPGETFGRVLFVGGCYVKPMNCSNAVAIVDLDTEQDSRVTIHEDLPWASRMGHSCTIFPHGGKDKIWLLGGMDEWGATLNDVWVSGDGKTWENIYKTGAVNRATFAPAKMDWNARCMAGISEKLDDHGNKKALWFGGGFLDYQGKPASDLWKFEDNKWTKIGEHQIHDKPYLSSGLAFIGKDTSDATGIYLLGGYEFDHKKFNYFQKITLENGVYGTTEISPPQVQGFDTVANAFVVTALFRGCLWYMIFTNEGSLGINISKLFYWIPVVTSRTVIIN